MGWNVRYYHRRAKLSWTESIFDLINGLIAAGAMVYGSSDGTSFDNSGSGATNYLDAHAKVDNANAWIRLRWPAVGGVTRELCIQRTNTLGRFSHHWSSDGTGFVTGASASARPTAADEQYTSTGANFATANSYTYPAGGNGLYSSLITGDADEGYSFFWGQKQPTDLSFSAILFMDVLEHVPAANADADPAIYCTGTRGAIFPAQNHTHSAFVDTTINNVDTNIGGWFKKGTADEAWVVYPICEWGTMSTGFGSSESLAREETAFRSQERVKGWYEYQCLYTRGTDRGFTTQRGLKGMSRLFGVVSQGCFFGTNPANTRRHIGYGLTIPWDGVTEAREM